MNLCKIYSDGSYWNGNKFKEPMGLGIYVLNVTPKKEWEFTVSISEEESRFGNCTSAIAEYEALYLSIVNTCYLYLDKEIEENTKFIFHSDNRFVVESLNDYISSRNYLGYRNDFKYYSIQCCELLTNILENYEVKWIPRKQLLKADLLSREAIGKKR